MGSSIRYFCACFAVLYNTGQLDTKNEKFEVPLVMVHFGTGAGIDVFSLGIHLFRRMITVFLFVNCVFIVVILTI
jgi:hypothetical protein